MMGSNLSDISFKNTSPMFNFIVKFFSFNPVGQMKREALLKSKQIDININKRNKNVQLMGVVGGFALAKHIRISSN